MGVGDDFEGPFTLECFNITPEADELFLHMSQLLDKSMSEQIPKSHKQLDETATGFTAVHRLKISQLWCLRKNICEYYAMKAVSKIAHGMSVQGAYHTSL